MSRAYGARRERDLPAIRYAKHRDTRARVGKDRFMTRVATPQFQFRQGEDVFIRIRRVQRGGHITLSATVGTTGNFTLTWGGRTTTAQIGRAHV